MKPYKSVLKESDTMQDIHRHIKPHIEAIEKELLKFYDKDKSKDQMDAIITVIKIIKNNNFGFSFSGDHYKFK